jgi:hypothetical protein
VSRRFIAAAALFHVTVAVLLLSAGRMDLAPRMVNRDGIAPATDSIVYRNEAILLASALRSGGFAAWRQIAAPFHVRLLSLGFALFQSFAGAGILAAEWLNLACYLAIATLTFAIGRETGGVRSGAIAAGTIALWPSFLFHTVQFLKDPLFIAGALLLVFVVVTWLTRTYGRRHAAASAIVMAGAAALLLAIRAQFVVVIVALIAIGATLLVGRQIAARRLLIWNLACALVAVGAALLALAQSTRTYEKVKAYPSPDRGELKSATAGGGVRLPAFAVWSARDAGASLALGKIRERYAVSDRLAGSGIDDDVALHSARDVIANLPRAAAIGLWAPFPNTWLQRGRMVGRVGRITAGAEMAVIYVLELLSVAALILPPRRLPALLLVGFAALGVTALATVVTNVGTLYRFRYPFWILLIVTGISGGEKLARAGLFAGRRRAATVAACLLLVAAGCSRPRQGDALAVRNLTGVSITALYLSPSDATTWQENVLGGDVLRDGDTVAVRLDSRHTPQLWDLRADAGNVRAEWRRLDRRRISAITLSVRQQTAVAELR